MIRVLKPETTARLRALVVGAVRTRRRAMTTELFHPRTPADVVEIVRGASADGRTLLPVGGRAHIDRGNPTEPDAELWTTQLDGIVAYEPAEMLVVVEAGMRCGELATALAEHDQEWPVDAPAEATVGGVIAAGASSFRRRRVGHVRDTVVEMTTVTGDGRTITSGARTVKNVSGFDVHRLMTGSLGTLGVIVQVALKIRPLPRARAVLRASADDAMALADRLATAVPQAAAVLASPGAVTLHLEGWPDEVSELETMAGAIAPLETVDGPEGPSAPRGHDRGRGGGRPVAPAGGAGAARPLAGARRRRDRLGRRGRAGGTRDAARHGGRSRRDRSRDPRTGRAGNVGCSGAGGASPAESRRSTHMACSPPVASGTAAEPRGNRRTRPFRASAVWPGSIEILSSRDPQGSSPKGNTVPGTRTGHLLSYRVRSIRWQIHRCVSIYEHGDQGDRRDRRGGAARPWSRPRCPKTTQSAWPRRFVWWPIPPGSDCSASSRRRARPACATSRSSLGLTQPTVSHHLKVLTDAGLLAREQRGRWAFFRLQPHGLDLLRDALAPS